MKNEEYPYRLFGAKNVKWRLFFIFHFSLVIFIACQDKRPTTITPAFYHWQTHLNLTPSEKSLMDSLGSKKIYAKFFDIDLNNGQPLPQAVIQINNEYLNDIEIIPTVFITNRVFKNITEKEIEQLADNILSKIKELNTADFLEIQFDCDWTQTTKDKYFYFLKNINSQLKERSLMPPIVSATIRLHQLKYPEKTGIPPVDRGMLMFYNIGDLEDWETENSILDLAISEKYLIPDTQYPIPLDIALPIFNWGVVFRHGELIYLINGLREDQLMDKSRFEKINENRYAVIKSSYLDGYYLYKNDLIRLEKTTPELLEEAGYRLSKFLKLGKSKTDNLTVSFYHLDTATLKAFHYRDFEKILGAF